MAFWVEVHCDTTREQRCAVPATPYGEPGCWSDRGNLQGSMGLTPARAAKHAKELAREYGWKNKRGVGWLCPACQKYAVNWSLPFNT